ncbi:MAG: hypothetical protein WCI57_04530 [Candidatus Berkelbacteria bacterium]
MCGPVKKAQTGATADGKPFSVNPATVEVAAREEHDDDVMTSSGLTRGQITQMCKNATKLTEEEKMDPHSDRGYYSP